MKITDKQFQLTVDTEGQLVNKTFDLDKNAKIVHGIMLSSDRPTLLFFRGSLRAEISGQEIIPENFETKLFMSGIGVAPDVKYKTLGEGENGVITGNGEIKIQYKDTPNAEATFEPYKVMIYVKCEMK